MLYLLDSDSLSDFYEPLSSGHPNIIRRMASFGETDLVVGGRHSHHGRLHADQR